MTFTTSLWLQFLWNILFVTRRIDFFSFIFKTFLAFWEQHIKNKDGTFSIRYKVPVDTLEFILTAITRSQLLFARYIILFIHSFIHSIGNSIENYSLIPRKRPMRSDFQNDECCWFVFKKKWRSHTLALGGF